MKKVLVVDDGRVGHLGALVSMLAGAGMKVIPYHLGGKEFMRELPRVEHTPHQGAKERERRLKRARPR